MGQRLKEKKRRRQREEDIQKDRKSRTGRFGNWEIDKVKNLESETKGLRKLNKDIEAGR